MNQELRVGIIGAGAIARDVHAPIYHILEKVKITAVSDIVRENAEDLAKEYDIEHVFTNFHDMLHTLELDIVSICTPNKFHAEATIAALKTGCHVLCEKPPAMSVAEAENMANMAKEAGKVLSFNFCYRHTPEVTALKRFVDANELGDIYATRVHALRRRGIPGWGVFTNKDLQGGGPLIDIGVHMLDTALYLMGYPDPDTVLGITYKRLGNKKGVGILGEWDWEHFSVEDMARGMITFKNGASLIVESAFAVNMEKHEEMSVSLMGDKGGADVFPLKIYQEKYQTLIDITPSYLLPKNKYKSQIEKFVNDCFVGENREDISWQGLKLQRIISSLYKSAEKGIPIKFS